MRLISYVSILIFLNTIMIAIDWASIALALIVVLTYFFYPPKKILHPNNILFGFFFLYVVLPSSLSLILDIIDWNYYIPWAEAIQWKNFSKYVLYQAEFTFLVLYFFISFFSKSDGVASKIDPNSYSINNFHLIAISVVAIFLAALFIVKTAGFSAWINNYSYTYLTKREGYGLLNVIIIGFGNFVVFLLGLKFYQERRNFWLISITIAVIVSLAYVNGVKARFIFLLLIFFSPFLLGMRLSLKRILGMGAGFFILLYLGTLIRTQGFYASPAYFMEMLIAYFNSYQLHDHVVVSRSSGLLLTAGQLFVKPLQILGYLGSNLDFDISVMLTKEFFPDQWYREKATQQWPLDTELYLNYHGFLFSWIPLAIYSFLISFLYRSAIIRANIFLLPIYMMEFQRLFSMLRGTLIPWDYPIYLAQYVFIYLGCLLFIGKDVDKNKG